MNEYGFRKQGASLAELGLKHVSSAYWNLSPAELVEETIVRGEGVLTDTGALAVETGEFTGRAPKDRYIVEDEVTRDSVWWGDVNIRFDETKFDLLYNRVCSYLTGRDVYVRDSYVCAEQEYRLNLRVVTEYPWSNLFAYNLFARPEREEILNFSPDWYIICAPGFKADPAVDGTRQHNFVILNFSRKVILIGGTGYTGEIKKSVFSVLNYLLPHERKVLSMHCSANIGKEGDTALFFGLSGTGKTTLSSDPYRRLIGDDEHGWTENSVFNFEGGCYAKCIHLTREREPQIYDAIRFGALLENINFTEGTTSVDYNDNSITENTRVSYPIHYIDNIAIPSAGSVPENIFFLTCDAFGVLPPISKLSAGQAMYHFISGYTAKVAGTEAGVTEPQTTFSACFGAPFLPLHPTKYAELLGQKMKKHNVKVWLINTGWSGGSYGTGQRMDLKYTRAMITAALTGQLGKTKYNTHEIFGLQMPLSCPGIPSAILNPRDTWSNKDAYDTTALSLAEKFVANFKKYAEFASKEVMAAAPNITPMLSERS